MSEGIEAKGSTTEPVIASIRDAVLYARTIGYPILVRPWGCDENSEKLFHVVNNDEELIRILPDALRDSVNQGRVDMVHLTKAQETKSYIPTPK
ncbi:hypothetical protein K2Y00_03130 [Patescibacteria group bacterium]|nr:hypothetical protein [Patescibacteria group bacterium]